MKEGQSHGDKGRYEEGDKGNKAGHNEGKKASTMEGRTGTHVPKLLRHARHDHTPSSLGAASPRKPRMHGESPRW